jgi:Uncharacterized conserved protein (COG2071)
LLFYPQSGDIFGSCERAELGLYETPIILLLCYRESEAAGHSRKVQHQKGSSMRIPTIRGLIDRRVLVNFRVEAAVLSKLCPAPFRPQLIDGVGMAGICLIRLKHIRPRFLPSFLGISSENAAHRIAVEWDSDAGVQSGVYVIRRDSSSILNSLAGGRLFPGIHNRAEFQVRESKDEYHIEMASIDGSAHVSVDGRVTDNLPTNSVFPTLAKCSMFYQAGAIGYSPAKPDGKFDGLELRAYHWNVQPLRVTNVHSSFFDDRQIFPEGSVTFDNALVMRGIEHEWHSRESICCPSS